MKSNKVPGRDYLLWVFAAGVLALIVSITLGLVLSPAYLAFTPIGVVAFALAWKTYYKYYVKLVEGLVVVVEKVVPKVNAFYGGLEAVPLQIVVEGKTLAGTTRRNKIDIADRYKWHSIEVGARVNLA